MNLPPGTKWIPQWQGLYAVDDCGNVWSVRYSHSKSDTWYPLNASVTDGYKQVSLARRGRKETRKVHRLVAEAFVQKPSGMDCVNHLNFDRSDNSAVNLEWTTRKGNHLYTVAANRHAARERHGSHKLTAELVERIRMLHKIGIGYYRLSHLFQVSKSQIARVCRGDGWHDGGATWRRCEKEAQ